MNRHERRRVAFATVFTVVALLALWTFNSRDSSTSGTAAAVSVDGEGSDTAPTTTEYVPEAPMFVGGEDEPTPPGVIDVAVPPPPGANDVLAKATFSRYLGATTPVCTTMLAPDGAALTVRNVDNGQSVTCTNTYGKAIPAGAELVLDTDLYVQIGSLPDAPINVRITW